MSVVAVEKREPNKALFRTTALAGSIFMWSVMGYFALTYVPKFDRPVEPDGPIVQGAPPDIDVVLPPPPKPELVKTVELPKDTPILDTPVTTPPTLTTRPTASTRNNPLPGDLYAGPPPTAPAQGVGPAENSGPAIAPPLPLDRPTIEPTLIVPPIEEPPVVIAPPTPKLVVNPVRVSGSNPIFPTRALEREVSGEVTLSFTVSATGHVENVEVTGEEPRGYGFARAAREAITGWRFQPQTIDGIAVAYPARYSFSFKLED